MNHKYTTHSYILGPIQWTDPPATHRPGRGEIVRDSGDPNVKTRRIIPSRASTLRAHSYFSLLYVSQIYPYCCPEKRVLVAGWAFHIRGKRDILVFSTVDLGLSTGI